jgi:periplasmic protein TonB
MIRMSSVKTGELVALRLGQGRGEGAATVPVRPERPLPLDDASLDLSNVVPFMRPATQEAVRAAPDVALPADAARVAANASREHGRLVAFVALSVLVHGGLLAFLWREPEPLASIGLPVISVELVVGATAPAGVAAAPGENETQAAAAPTDPQPTESAREAEQKATEQPQEVPAAKLEVAPEGRTQLERQPDAPQPSETRPEPPSDPAPAVTMALSPEPVKPVEIKPVQKPAPKQVQRRPEPEPKQRVAARPTETKTEPSRVAAPTKDRASERARASAPANPANNLGVGRSDYDTNYRGLVAAHLARYKQYPADARSRGDRGTASVTFSIGGSGGVTSVSLARGSGVASIDQEVVAMVRRASPFPPPPGGRPQSFTVPVSFSLR